MGRLTLSLLGPPALLRDDHSCKGLYAHAAALLIYLAVESGRSHSRDALADLLWPDESPEVARQNLRQAISRLRTAIGDRDSSTPALLTDRASVGLNPAADIWCDVHAFEAACRDLRLDADPALTAQTIRWLKQAAGLYRGDFLTGFSLPGSIAFEEWLQNRREHWRRQAIAVLEGSCAYYQRAGQSDEAIAAARRLVALAPDAEQGHRLLMQLLADSGQGVAALAQYRACELHLREELGVAPAEETRALRDAIEARLGAGSEPLNGRRERRRITVVHCGAALDSAVDPEDLLDWRARLVTEATAVAADHGGRLRVLESADVRLSFGYPLASADDTERAVKAALALRARMKSTGDAPPCYPLGVGIAIGEVAIVDDAGADIQMVGDPLLTAAALRHAAKAGEILLAPAAAERVQQRYDCRRQTAQARPALRLLGPLRETHQPAASLPLIGRDDARAVLLQRWQRAQLGVGAAALIDGEAGMGKSHLLRHLVHELSADTRNILQLRCLPGHAATALEPFLRALRERGGLGSGVSADRRRFAAFTRRLGLTDAERTLLGSLLDLTAPDAAAASQMARQQATRLMLKLLQAAANTPLLVCVEDAQWMDPSSQELLARLMDELERLPILLLITADAGFDPPWLRRRNVERLRLAPLPAAEAAAVVRAAAAGALSEELVEQIVLRSGGVPLFLQEFARACRDAGSRSLGSARALPASLQESLLARLDRLQEAGQLARLAAVIGREFDLQSLQILAQAPLATLSPLLARLIENHIVEPVAAGGYSFCHGLIHQLAYGTLLRGERRELHARLASHLGQRAAAGEAVAPEVIAEHLLGAEQMEPALRQFYLAGVRAFARAAMPECVTHLRRALSLLWDLPAAPERDALELRLRIALGLPLMVMDDAQSEARDNFERAEQLSHLVTDRRLLLTALRSLASYCIGVSAFKRVEPVIERFVALSADEDPVVAADGHVMHGIVLLLQGQPRKAHTVLTQGVALGQAATLEHARRYGSDPVAIGDAALAFCASVRGHPDQADELLSRALTRARQLSYPLSLVWCANMALCVLQLHGDLPRALALSEEVLTVCEAHGIANWAHWARLVRQRALLEEQRDVGALLEVLRSRERLMGARGEFSQPYADVLVVECCLLLGEIDRGLQVVNEGLRSAEAGGGNLLRPELLRLHGELLLARDPAARAAAVAEMRAALQLAARQRSRVFELRAALSLARALGPRGEPLRLVQRAASNFRSAAITADQRAAEALLAELTP